MGEAAAAAAEDIQKGTAVVVPAPRPSKGVASWAVDLLERLVVRLGHDKTKPLHWLSGNFAPVQDETPPAAGLPVRGHLPVRTPPLSIILLRRQNIFFHMKTNLSCQTKISLYLYFTMILFGSSNRFRSKSSGEDLGLCWCISSQL
jgi:hypothetical protein